MYIYMKTVYIKCVGHLQIIYLHIYILERDFICSYMYIHIYIYDVPLTFVPKGGVDAPFGDKHRCSLWGQKGVYIYIERERDRLDSVFQIDFYLVLVGLYLTLIDSP